MMAYELKNITILKNYTCIISNLTINDAMNRLINSELDDTGSL